jgi:tRNA G18 (ribose-2'-O)-methylase SpoU
MHHKRVALVAHGGTPLAGCDLRGGVTFLLGAEREGLPEAVERDLEATIPVEIESLNVAVTGAIALYEWRRQTQIASSWPAQGVPSNQP